MSVLIILLIIYHNISYIITCNLTQEIGGNAITGPDKLTARKRQGQDDILRRILPMLAMPFITQTTLLPMMLFFMKITLLNSVFLGKLAIILWSVVWLRNRILDGQGGLYSHNINMNDYGHH